MPGGNSPSLKPNTPLDPVLPAFTHSADHPIDNTQFQARDGMDRESRKADNYNKFNERLMRHFDGFVLTPLSAAFILKLASDTVGFSLGLSVSGLLAVSNLCSIKVRSIKQAQFDYSIETMDLLKNQMIQYSLECNSKEDSYGQITSVSIQPHKKSNSDLPIYSDGQNYEYINAEAPSKKPLKQSKLRANLKKRLKELLHKKNTPIISERELKLFKQLKFYSMIDDLKTLNKTRKSHNTKKLFIKYISFVGRLALLFGVVFSYFALFGTVSLIIGVAGLFVKTFVYVGESGLNHYRSIENQLKNKAQKIEDLATVHAYRAVLEDREDFSQEEWEPDLNKKTRTEIMNFSKYLIAKKKNFDIEGTEDQKDFDKKFETFISEHQQQGQELTDQERLNLREQFQEIYLMDEIQQHTFRKGSIGKLNLSHNFLWANSFLGAMHGIFSSADKIDISDSEKVRKEQNSEYADYIIALGENLPSFSEKNSPLFYLLEDLIRATGCFDGKKLGRIRNLNQYYNEGNLDKYNEEKAKLKNELVEAMQYLGN